MALGGILPLCETPEWLRVLEYVLFCFFLEPSEDILAKNKWTPTHSGHLHDTTGAVLKCLFYDLLSLCETTEWLCGIGEHFRCAIP